jgi:hypothetical protein
MAQAGCLAFAFGPVVSRERWVFSANHMTRPVDAALLSILFFALIATYHLQ